MRNVEVRALRLRPDAIIPRYRHAGDAGFDLCAVEELVIPPGEARVAPTGLALAIPDGFELQIRLRSSAALNTPLVIPNAPATIDAGYRGEIGIILRNLSAAPYCVAKGARLAQGVIAQVVQASFVESDCLPPSARGTDGFGSTGA